MSGRRALRVLAFVILVFHFSGIGVEAQSTRPAATAPAARQVRVTFVDAVSGAPVAGVRGNYWPDRQTANNSKEYTSDARGECVLTIDSQAKELSFFYQRDKYVQSLKHFGGDVSAEEIPLSYTLRLQPGMTVGGVVQDEAGKGVEGAKVQLQFAVNTPDVAGGMSFNYGQSETNKEGKWTFTGAPANPKSAEVYARHPDYFADRNSERTSDMEALRKSALVTMIRRGVAVTGSVLDPEGRPVAGAAVQMDNVAPAKSDEQGKFRMPGIVPGHVKLIVAADKFSIQLVEVDAAEGAKPVEVRLEPGHVLRGQVVDSKGRPVPLTYITVRKWRNELLFVGFKTDEQGKFEWNSAPKDEVSLMVNGGLARDLIPVKADGTEVRITVASKLSMRGRVVDDATGKPIEKFTVHLSADRAVIGTGWYTDRPGRYGAYDVTMQDDAATYQVRVLADGYMPVDSPPLRSEDGVVSFDARLKHGGGVAGSLLQPDGKPAQNAEIYLWDRMLPTFENGVIQSGATASIVVKSDSNGHFELPPRNAGYKIVVIQESGWTDLTLKDADALKEIKLRAWCTISGRVMLGGKPTAGQTVWIRPYNMATDDGVHHQLYQYRTTTDEQGRFTLSRVIDGPTTVSVMRTVKLEGGGASFVEDHGVPLQLTPGQTVTNLQIGGTGRAVIAHILIGDDLKARGLIPHNATLHLDAPPAFVRPPAWDLLTAEAKQQLRQNHEATEEYQRYAKSVKEFEAALAPDGTARFEDVPAGRYILDVEVQRPSPEDAHMWRREAGARMDVVVPEGDASGPIDAGSLVMGKVQRPDPGQAAPVFEPATYDGKQLKLADFHGKFVLLDFWATWCGPCIAEFPHVERLYKTYSSDPRVVILGVSVDEHMTEPDKYLKTRKLPWLQAYSGSSAWITFGISAIPSFWLIGPDGKVIAKEIPPEDLDRVLKDALK